MYVCLILIAMESKTKKKEKFPWTMRIPQELLEEVRTLAEMHERSVNGEIIYLLKKAMEMAKKEEPFGL